MKLIDLRGRTFGRLTVGLRDGATPSGKATWQCTCKCGRELVVTGEHLLIGHTSSCGCACEGARLGTAEERFDSRYMPVPWSGCWIWTGKSNIHQYGVMAVGSRKMLAHRFSYERFRGPIPEGLSVCHTCDVTWCVNPSHLFVGTHADNTADMMRKGRHNCGRKLTPENVNEIRAAARIAGNSQRSIASRFGIDPSRVSRIVNDKTWAAKSN